MKGLPWKECMYELLQYLDGQAGDLDENCYSEIDFTSTWMQLVKGHQYPVARLLHWRCWFGTMGPQLVPDPLESRAVYIKWCQMWNFWCQGLLSCRFLLIPQLAIVLLVTVIILIHMSLIYLSMLTLLGVRYFVCMISSFLFPNWLLIIISFNTVAWNSESSARLNFGTMQNVISNKTKFQHPWTPY